MLNYEKLNKNNLIKKYKNPIKMEITKSTSFNLMPSTENNPMIDDIPDLLENRDEKPFIKFFSISPMNKKVINDLMMDETRDFLMNLIACNDEDSKETAEIDYEISLKHSKNPFLHADDLFDSKEQYKKKFQILEEKKQSKINYDSQEEINDPEIRKKVEETRQIRKKDSNNDAKLKEEVLRRKSVMRYQENAIKTLKIMTKLMSLDYNFEYHGNKFLFSDNSLFIFDESNYFRKLIIWILTSGYYQALYFGVCLLNLIAFEIYDHSFRIYKYSPERNYISQNLLELICYVFYSFDFILNVIGKGLIFGKGTYFKIKWNIFFFFLLIASFMIYLDQNSATKFFLCIRLFNILRIIIIFPTLQKTFNSYIRAALSVYKVYLSFFGLMLFYSVFGLYLFYGLEENRCRASETPPPGQTIWEPLLVEFPSYCGDWQCDIGYCRNLADYGLPPNPDEKLYEVLNYGMSNFSTIYNSLYTVFLFFAITGWTSNTYNYWRATNSLICAIFFTSMIIIGALFFLNILLAALYESFIKQSSIKNSLKKKIQDEEKKNGTTNNKIDLKSLVELKASKSHLFRKLKKKEIFVSTKLFQFFHNNTQIGQILFEAANSKKRYIRLQGKILNFIHFNNIFRRTMNILIVFDIIILSIDNFPVDSSYSYILETIDFTIFLIYCIELLLKIYSYGIKMFIKNPFYCLDLLLIISHVFQYSYQSYLVSFTNHYSFRNVMLQNSYSGSFIKPAKIFRIFEGMYYSKFFASFSILFKAFLNSLIKMKFFILNSVILILMIALLGKELFAYEVRKLEGQKWIEPDDLRTGEKLKVNYDTFSESIIATIFILYNEEWHLALYQHYLGTDFRAFIFYIPLMILGQMTYMTLFNALFLNNFIKNIRKLIIEKENQFSPTMKIIFKKVKTLWANMTSTFLNKKSSNDKQIRDKLKVFETRTAFKKSPTTKEKTHIKRLGSLKNKFKSFSNLRKNRDHLFNETAKNLFSSSQKKNFSRNESLISKPTVYFKKIDDFVESNNDLNKGIFQSFCNYVIQHHYFQNLMIAITCASLILLTINTPISDPRKSGIIACEILEKIFIALYILEFGLNVKAFGKKIFDRPFSQNCYDVLNVSISIASLFEDKYKSRTFETMKVIRVFRLINTGNNMFYHINLIMNSFVNALPNILKLLVFFLIFLYVFSLFAMKFLKGILFSCLNTNGQDILIEDKIDCFDYGGDWIEKDLNYDNILQSFFTLFVVTSSEGWSILMFEANQTKGNDLNMKKDVNGYWSIFFLLIYFIGKILLLNMFIGIIIENIIVNKQKALKIDKLNDEQKEWALIKQNIMKMTAQKNNHQQKINCLRINLPFLYHKYTHYFVHSCVIINILVFMIFHHRQSEELDYALRLINMIFVIIFGLDTLSKAFEKRSRILKKPTIIYQILVVLIAYINLILIATQPEQNPNHFVDQDHHSYRIFNAVSKALQFTLIIFVLKRNKKMKSVFKAIGNIIPIFLSMLTLIFLYMYIYAIIAMNIFSYLKPQMTVNGIDVHFRTFFKAMFTLIRIASTEVWFMIVADCVRKQSPNFICYDVIDYESFLEYGFMDCGTKWGYLYFLSFHFIYSLIIFNLFIAIIITAFDEESKALKNAVSRYQLKDINNLWKKYDSEGTGYMNYKDFWRFSSEIALIFGVSQEELLDINNRKNFLKNLKIPIYENPKEKIYCYKFHDVIIELCKVSVMLKYGVIDLEQDDAINFNEEIPAELGKNSLQSSKISTFMKFFNLKDKSEFIFNKTVYDSGDMVSIIMVQKHIKKWVRSTRDNLKPKVDKELEEVENTIRKHSIEKIKNLDDMFNLTKAMMSKNKETVNPLPSDSFSTREAEIIANTLTGDSGSNRNFLNKTKKKEAERKNFLSFKSSE